MLMTTLLARDLLLTHRDFRVLGSACLVAFLCAPVSAQDAGDSRTQAALCGEPVGASRAALSCAERVAKAATVHPVQPGKVERAFLTLSDERVLDRLLNPRHGWFLRLGPPVEDGGLGAGPAWRASNPARTYTFTASAAASPTGNWIGELSLLLPALARDRLFASATTSRSERASDDFWGLGPSSVDTARTIYKRTEIHAGGTLGVRLLPWLHVGAGGAWLEPSLRRSRGAFPSIQDVFTPAAAPGVLEQPAFLRSDLVVDLDYRDSIPPTRTARRLDQLPLAAAWRGGRYQLTRTTYRDQEMGRYSFRRTTIDVQQHLPFLRGQRALSLRALGVFSDAFDGQIIPFYLMPTLGGTTTLRGYQTHRFRDENLLVLQAEYRYEINPLMSGAIFVDTGQVAPRARALALSRFKTAYGTGVRFGAGGAAAFRLDVAFGAEGPRVLVGAGHAF
jgi:hypothetical protein